MGKDDFVGNQAENWFLQGEEKFTSGDFEGAIFCYDKVIEIESNYQLAWRQRGYALYKLERDKEALVSLGKAIEINNNDYLVWYWRGLVLNVLERYEEAQKC
ncbi:MAG: tetratricopeptide repeat protein [Sphaerospermopsis kisseleviana]